MNRELLDKWCERGILALVLAILAYSPLAIGAADTLQFLVVQGLTMGVMLIWALRLWINPKAKFLWPPICWFVVAFVGYAIYRYLNCDLEYVGRTELIRVLIYAFLFLAIINNLHRQEFTQVISFTLIFLAMAISGYAIFQFVTKSNWVWHYPTQYPGRASGTFISPNHLAGYLEMVLPLAFAYTLAGRVKPVTRILIGYAGAVIIVGIGTTLSRGGIVAAAVGLVFLFAILTLHRSYRLPAMLLLVALIGGGYYLAPKSQQLILRLKKTEMSGSKQQLLDVRYVFWKAALGMWHEDIWRGVGPGHFNYRYPQYRSELAQHRPDYAHNDYLNALADWGLAGVGIIGLFLAALAYGIAKSWRYIRRAETEFRSSMSNKFAFVLGASASLVALLAHSAMDFNMQIPANAILAFTLAALLSGHLRFATDGYWLSAQLWSKGLATLIVLAGMAYLGNQELRLGRECALLGRANKLPEFSPAQFDALKAASAAEPTNFDTTYRLGELYRAQAFLGGDTYQELAKEAMLWYARGTNVNRFDALNYIGYGMCLDFIDQHEAAEPYFQWAEELDPNGFQSTGAMGWHYVQCENWIAAKAWLERSIRLEWTLPANQFAATYLALVNDRLNHPITDLIVPAKPAPQ